LARAKIIAVLPSCPFRNQGRSSGRKPLSQRHSRRVSGRYFVPV